MILVASLASFLSGTLRAEDPSPYITVVIVEVIPGKVNEFVAIQKEYSAARKKAGRPARSFWQEARGNTNTFHIVSEAENFAAQDEPADRVMNDTQWANWVNRVTAVTKSRQILTLQALANSYIAPKDGEEPNLVRLNYTTLASRRDRGAYISWLNETYTPTVRKLGMKGRSVYRVRFGGNTNTIVTSLRLNSWSELDEPLVLSALSDSERAKVVEDLNDIHFHDNESYILRYRADMSHDGP